MMTKTHMQDQVANRIERFMHEDHLLDVDEVLQNVATLSIVAVFLLLGLNW
jgi:hypothetical protein